MLSPSSPEAVTILVWTLGAIVIGDAEDTTCCMTVGDVVTSSITSGSPDITSTVLLVWLWK